MTERYYLFVRATNVASWVWLNDAPITLDSQGAGIVVCEPVDVWIKPGLNMLRVELDRPKVPGAGQGAALVEVSLFIADHGSNRPRPGHVLARFDWPPCTEGEKERYPYQHEQEVAISPAPDTLLWREAERFTQIDEHDRQEIIARASLLRQALVNGQPDQAYKLLSYRYQDEARAEGKPEARIRAAVMGGYRDMLSFGHLDFEPLHGGFVFLRPHADGLVVHVTRDQDLQAILAHHGRSGSFFGIPVFAARIHGAWTLVR